MEGVVSVDIGDMVIEVTTMEQIDNKHYTIYVNNISKCCERVGLSASKLISCSREQYTKKNMIRKT